MKFKLPDTKSQITCRQTCFDDYNYCYGDLEFVNMQIIKISSKGGDREFKHIQVNYIYVEFTFLTCTLNLFFPNQRLARWEWYWKGGRGRIRKGSNVKFGPQQFWGAHSQLG